MRNVLVGLGIAAEKAANKLIAYWAMKQFPICVCGGSLDKVSFMVEHLLKLNLSSDY